MTQEQLKAFLAKVKGDTSIQEKLNAAQSPDEVVSIAREHGHEFSSNELIQPSDADLESLAGGGGCYNGTMKPPTEDGNCGKTGMWICLKK